ncbi:histidinol-phosphate transaminase [Leptolyngbyaceae cyanobacterium CCMR0082]|uniref:Histidinol-phosphate aminotransferase n=1 Tax=Adonisia turfae CCMR0082 TaxID=2304604 RepID=A0A6M0S1D0_9CYAN|nr:histidinol-phosphate transaminase [Adonisia turfae]MDV3350906.1 histidinol-phosphate transaminase [Leptothoe sp. LEGE 181152]NEZ61923.1 histidinol-phosphate transaminase [Adonisia turfae CCMR0082]
MLPFLRADLANLKAYKPHPPMPKPYDQLDTNESPIDLPDDVKASLAASYQQAIAANRYPDGGHTALKQAIANYVAESSAESVMVAENNISVGNGSDELIRSLLIAAALGNGSILVASPTFSMYGILAQTLGIPVIDVGRRENFCINLEKAQTAMEQHAIRVVFMVHPNSPTANPLTTEEIAWLRQLPNDVLVVIDEAYFEFSGHTLVADSLSRSNWVVLRTFSKAFRLAAHRVGYAVAQPALIEALEKVRLPYNLPSFSQAAALAALVHRASLLAAVQVTIAERQTMVDWLKQQPILTLWPSAANFIYCRLSEQGRSQLGMSQAEGLQHIFGTLRQQGTLIRYTGGGLRISLGTPEENQRTRKNLEAISEPLTAHA